MISRHRSDTKRSVTHQQWAGGSLQGFTAANVDPNDPTGSRTMGYFSLSILGFYKGIANQFAIADIDAWSTESSGQAPEELGSSHYAARSTASSQPSARTAKRSATARYSGISTRAKTARRLRDMRRTRRTRACTSLGRGPRRARDRALFGSQGSRSRPNAASSGEKRLMAIASGGMPPSQMH